MFLGESGVGLLAQKPVLGGNWVTFGISVSDIGEPMIPFNRARRVVLGTSMEQLEHVPWRIRGRNTSSKAYVEGNWAISDTLGTLVRDIG